MPSAAEPHLDGAEDAEHHRRVDVAHVGDAERLARQLADAHAQDHAALLAAVVEERAADRGPASGRVVTELARSAGAVTLKASAPPSAQRPTAWRVASASSA